MSFAMQNFRRVIRLCLIFIRFLFNGVPADHGFEHAVQVAANAMYGLRDFNCSEEQVLLVVLAALLHDADDRKLQPKLSILSRYSVVLDGLPNAKLFLRCAGVKAVEQVCEMINLVSFSKNRNTSSGRLYRYIARDADRLDSLGHRGIERTFAFNKHNTAYGGCPLFSRYDDLILHGFGFSRKTLTVSDLNTIVVKCANVKSDRTTMFTFFITDWSQRRISASRSRRLVVKMLFDYQLVADRIVQMIRFRF